MTDKTDISKPIAKVTAHQLLQDFLIQNNITLVIDKLENCIITASDGSILIKKPFISAKYNE
jgi:hypothetical protein